MTLAIIFLWGCLGLIAYAYFLYPVLLFLVYSMRQVARDWHYLCHRSDRRAGRFGREEVPPVSVVIAAFNEESCLPDRIRNLQELDYPSEKLEVILVSDGSTDGTNEILRSLRDSRFRPVFLPARGGKASALNAGVAASRGEVLVLSDASTMMDRDVVRILARHFADPDVGVACGSLRFVSSTESAQTEGVYWRYESILRLMEARLGSTLTASGAIYAVRRECYEDLPADTLIDDFVVPMNARRKGYEIVYDPEAVATEFAPATIQGEFLRRVRIATGSFRALPQLLRVPMPGFTRVAFFSHKLLRWVLPFLFLGLLLSNLFLLDRRLYLLMLLAQLCFYTWAVLGGLLQGRLRKVRFALIGYFVLAMNAAFLVGFVRSLSRRREATWQRIS